MYIFELLSKLTKRTQITPNMEAHLPEEKNTSEYEHCEHIFIPIDSTKKVLACTKCGEIITSDKIPKKNFFIK